MKILPVILFDGVCNFCNSTVNLVIRTDKTKRIKFTTLQSFAGQQLMEQYGLNVADMQSFVFIEDGIAYTKSTAALRVCRYMSWLWPLLYAFIIVPKFIRDAVYDFIAVRRYKWFGIKDKCMVPTAEIRNRFLV